ncbi:MAG: hypothetical protein JO190_04465 [Candidatus Eremiobacteraeota bacterium]|nr:hypothetical protein [Candidatus Eremiobacteraeota bacterium]
MKAFTVLSTAAVAFLAACSGSVRSPQALSALPAVNEAPLRSGFTTVVPPQLRPIGGAAALPLSLDPSSKSAGGIYASEVYGTDIWAFPQDNNQNRKAMCVVTNVQGVNGIGVDAAGDLIDPDGGTDTVIVFKGPKMCGQKLGSVADPYGQPSDAASANAAKGTIVIANIFDTNKTPGSVSLCTLAHGCKVNLQNSDMNEVAGVALAKNGDCWASATDANGVATLTYFKACRGSGKKASGYRNAYYGGLDIDDKGNLVSLSYEDAKLYIYKGCNPRCTRISGPFRLKGEATFGHLNAASTKLVTGDFQYGRIDVYDYSSTKIRFAYSFNRGFSPSEVVEGAAFNPRSTE